jgi:hypothetical protein
MLTSIAEVTARRAKRKRKDLVIVALFSCTTVGMNRNNEKSFVFAL